MTAKSYNRGHEIAFDENTEHWYYVDNREAVSGPDRACGRCGKESTKNGHDACMANLPGVVNACCGHGHDDSYIMFEDGRSFYFNLIDIWDRDKDAVKVPRLCHPLDPNPQRYDEVIIK